MDPESTNGSAQRRLGALQAHLRPRGPTPGAGVSVSPTAAASNPVVEAAMVQDQAGNYAVDLPEVLSENGSWDVRRWVVFSLQAYLHNQGRQMATAERHIGYSGPICAHDVLPYS